MANTSHVQCCVDNQDGTTLTMAHAGLRYKNLERGCQNNEINELHLNDTFIYSSLILYAAPAYSSCHSAQRNSGCSKV